MIHCRLSRNFFNGIRENAISWSSNNASKLNASNIEATNELNDFCHAPNEIALHVGYCYADVHSGQTYNTAFTVSSEAAQAQTVAIFRFVIFVGRLPVQTLEHGHRNIAVFNFPSGAPAMIEALPIYKSHVVLPTAGLCDSRDWHSIAAANTARLSRRP